MDSLVDIAQFVIEAARTLGADEVKATASEGISTEVTQRDGRIEKWQDSQSRSVSTALLVNNRWSVHSTSDLRQAPLRAFLGRAVRATEMLEPDEDRRLPDPEELGWVDPKQMDLDDGGKQIDLRAWVSEVEAATLQASPDNLRSASAFVWSGRSSRFTATSNGFSGGFATTDYGHGSTVSLEDEGGRIPEAYYWDSVRHHEDLCAIDKVGAETAARACRRLGSSPVSSRKGPMLLENRQVARILGAALSPMRGKPLFEQRSCFSDKLGEQVGSAAFNLYDEPHMPRALGSRPYDSDARPTLRRDLFKDGVLQTWLLDVYYARRMNKPTTTGGTSNLVVPPGQRSVEEILAERDWVIQVEGFLGGNTNPASGQYSFGIHGTLFRKGEVAEAVSEMNITGSIFDLLGNFVEAADDVHTASTCRSPSLLFDAVQFSGS
jgi:PmbA protein